MVTHLKQLDVVGIHGQLGQSSGRCLPLVVHSGLQHGAQQRDHTLTNTHTGRSAAGAHSSQTSFVSHQPQKQQIQHFSKVLNTELASYVGIQPLLNINIRFCRTLEMDA